MVVSKMNQKPKKHFSHLDMFTILLVILMVFVAVVSVMSDLRFFIISLLYFLILAFIIYSYLTTYYIFERKSLIIMEGKNKREIFYREIVSIKLTKANKRKDVVGFTRKCIEINYGKNGREKIYISPLNRESFYDTLASKCKNLKEEN